MITNSGEETKKIVVHKFDEKSSVEFFEKFVELNNDKNIPLIVVLVDSYGGEVYSLLSMLDVIKTAKKPVCTVSLGKAMSCGAVLLSAGTKGYRYSGSNSTIVIHEVSSAAWGKNAEIQNEAKHTQDLNGKLMKILALNSGKKSDFFLNLSRSKGNVDLFFNSKEAKKLGLIDKIGLPHFNWD